jgi:1-deoxy-D-xylulose-5-phosphate synthase
MTALPLGRSVTIRSGQDVALLAFGSMVSPCVTVADRTHATLINMRFIKPLDRQAILDAAANHRILITVEENAIAGGAGSAVSELLARENVQTQVVHIGLEDGFIQHGTREECLQQAGLDEATLLSRVQMLAQNSNPLSQSTNF